MFEVFFVVVIFACIVWYEVPTLVREKQWPELISASVILAIGFALCVCEVLDIKLPNPSRMIAFIFHLKY